MLSTLPKLVIAFLLLQLFLAGGKSPRNKQQPRNRARAKPAKETAGKSSSSETVGTAGAVNKNSTNGDGHSKDAISESDAACPRPCDVSVNPQQRAIQAFWANNIILAEACACLALQVNSEDSLAEAIRYESMLSSFMPSSYRQASSSMPVERPRHTPPYALQDYELLGPIPIGKLEVRNEQCSLQNEIIACCYITSLYIASVRW